MHSPWNALKKYLLYLKQNKTVSFTDLAPRYYYRFFYTFFVQNFHFLFSRGKKTALLFITHFTFSVQMSNCFFLPNR